MNEPKMENEFEMLKLEKQNIHPINQSFFVVTMNEKYKNNLK